MTYSSHFVLIIVTSMALQPCPVCQSLATRCVACRIKASSPGPTISIAAQVGYVLTYQRDEPFRSMRPEISTDYVFMDQDDAEHAAKTKTQQARKDYDGAWDTPKWPPYVYDIRGTPILFIGDNVFVLNDEGVYKKVRVFHPRKIPGLGSEDEMKEKKPAKEKRAREAETKDKNKGSKKRTKRE